MRLFPDDDVNIAACANQAFREYNIPLNISTVNNKLIPDQSRPILLSNSLAIAAPILNESTNTQQIQVSQAPQQLFTQNPSQQQHISTYQPPYNIIQQYNNA